MVPRGTPRGLRAMTVLISTLPCPNLAASKDRHRTAIHLVLVTVAAAYFLAWPIWRAQYLIEIWPTEGWNAYYQDAAAAGLPMYPPQDSFVGNNYPPLSFYAIGFIGRVLRSDNLFVGRAISVIALAAIATEIFFAVNILAGGRAGGAIGGAWYLAIMARNSTTYVGTNDPQLAGLALMGAGLVWFLSRFRDKRSPDPALILMVLAGFWKHNIIAIPIASILWLLVNQGRRAFRPIALSGIAAAVGLATCALVFGSSFLPNLLANRQYAWSNVLGNIGHLQWSALALAVWAAWAMSDRKSLAARFTSLHIGAGLFACILQWFGHGVFGNAEFDLILALGIGVGVAYSRMETSWLAKRIGVNPSRDVMIAVLLLRLIIADRQETALLLISNDFRSSIHMNQNNVLSEAARVAALPGDIACSVKLVCRLAGKPLLVDEFKMEELVATGKATNEDVAGMLADRHVTPFVSTIPTSADADTSISHWWTAAEQ